MPFIATKEQLANVFTKGLQKQMFKELISKVDLFDIYKLA